MEQLCHRCGGHIIRANEVGLDDEEVIDGQSESLSAEKELKLLKAQVQDFARVCKVRRCVHSWSMCCYRPKADLGFTRFIHYITWLSVHDNKTRKNRP